MNIFRFLVYALIVLALAACGSPTVQTVARVGDVTLTQAELDARVARVLEAAQAAPAGQAPAEDEVKRGMVDLFVQQNLILSLARERGITVSDDNINAEVERVRGSIEQQGEQLDTVVQSRLGLPGGESTEFRQFISSILAQQKLAETLVTTDTVRTEVTEQVMPRVDQMVEQINVTHILVETEDEAKQVIERLDQGEDFAALAKELSTDPGSKDNGGVYEGIRRGQFIPEFEQVAFDELHPGETTQTPVKSQYGYHVIKLLSKEEVPDLTEEQAQQVIEQRIDQELLQRRQTAFADFYAQERERAIEEGRIELPDFAEPTAAPVEPTAAP